MPKYEPLNQMPEVVKLLAEVKDVLIEQRRVIRMQAYQLHEMREAERRRAEHQKRSIEARKARAARQHRRFKQQQVWRGQMLCGVSPSEYEKIVDLHEGGAGVLNIRDVLGVHLDAIETVLEHYDSVR